MKYLKKFLNYEDYDTVKLYLDENCIVLVNNQLLYNDLEDKYTIAVSLINDENIYDLNNHSNVSVDIANELTVNFIDTPQIHNATYAIDRIDYDNNIIPVCSGQLSINSMGFASFNEPLIFVAGHQYKITIKAWTSELYDTSYDLILQKPLFVKEYTIIGSNPTCIIGEPVFGVDRGIVEAGQANMGIKVEFREVLLPFGYIDNIYYDTPDNNEYVECTISASLYGVPQGNEPMPIFGEDELSDDVMNVDGPACLAENNIYILNYEGGVYYTYLFPDMMEEGNHYAITINSVKINSVKNGIGDDDDKVIIAELPAGSYYAVDFDVIENSENMTEDNI